MAEKVNGQGTNTSVNSKMAESTGKALRPMPMDEWKKAYGSTVSSNMPRNPNPQADSF